MATHLYNFRNPIARYSAASLLILLVTISVSVSAWAASADWSTFKGSAERNSVVDLPFPSQLDLIWDHQVPSTITASPVTLGDSLIVATDSGVVYSFSLETKILNWAFDAGGKVRSTPAIHDGMVYFLSQAGSFFALNLSDGAIVWDFETQGESQFAAYNYLNLGADKMVKDPWDLLQSSPVVAQGYVIFGSSDGHVYTLDKKTGEVHWTYRTGGRVHSSPAVYKDSVLVGSWDSNLYSFNIEDGSLDWVFQAGSEQKYNIWTGIQSSPVVDGDVVYIGGRDGFMYALGTDSGKQIWQYDMARSWVVPTVSVDDQHVYLGTSDNSLLLALDKRTGIEVWRKDTGAWTYSSPLVFNDAVLTATMMGKIMAVDPDTGELIFESLHGAFVDDVYAILNEDNKLRSDMSNGTIHDGLYGMMARVLASGGFMSSPALVNNQLIWLTTAGQILVWELK